MDLLSKSYRQQIRNTRLLTIDEERYLTKRISTCTKSRDKLIVHNLRLVLYFANKYKSKGVPIEDLLQAGTVGLIRAIDKFDPTFEVKLYTYAIWWIKEGMTRLFKVPPLCSIEEDELPGIYTPDFNIIEIRHDVTKAANLLNPNEIEVIKENLLLGESLSDLADTKGVSRQRIHTIKTRALHKMQSFY